MDKSLGDALLEEQARVREVLGYYKEISLGGIRAAFMERSLRRADRAVASGDIAAMAAAYKELREIE